MRLRPNTPEPPPHTLPFPLHMYIVGESLDGTEHVRYNLEVMLGSYGQQLVIRDVTLTLEA